MKIGILLVSTNKYKQFVQPLLDGINKHFLINHEVTIQLFTDELQDLHGGRLRIEQTIIPPYRFPEATLMRYRVITDHAEVLSRYDYLAYLDVDLAIVGEVGDEFLVGDITVVTHPGFYANNGWGSPNVDEKSKAYIHHGFRKHYVAGGVNGGKSDKFLELSKLLADHIDADRGIGVMAEWHDESHTNAFISYYKNVLYPDWIINELTPSYCSVPEKHQRIKWGIDHLPMKIVALTKKHEEVRS